LRLVSFSVFLVDKQINIQSAIDRVMRPNTWEDWYSRKEGTVEPEIPRLEELLELESAPRVLDFGCGAGRHTVYFARKGFEVYGFDASEAALGQAAKALEREGLQANLRVWDMTEPLPYEDRFFDAVIATRVIHHTYVENIKKIAEEINRTLKKEGYLFIQVSAFSPEEKSEPRQKEWEFEEPEPRTYVYTGGEEKGIPHHHFTKQELLNLFKNYSIIDFHSKTEHYRGFCLIMQKKDEEK